MKTEGAWRRRAAIMATGLALSGCALPSAVHRARVRADEAMANSNAALAAAHAEARQERIAEQNLRAEVAKLAAGEQALERQLAAERAAVPPPSPHKPAAKVRANAVFGMVVARARALAQAPYKAPAPVAPALRRLSFTDYGKLHLAGPVPGWNPDSRFHLQLYPAGYLFTWPEKIYVMHGGQAVPVQQTVRVDGDPALARAIHGTVPPVGFSVYTPLTRDPASENEFLSFLGASYFRAVGAGQTWGLSARGLAVDTALPHRAEEFPYFRSFWIIPPPPRAQRISFCALLDSPSLTGAYRFVVKPGATTVVHVKMVLFGRRAVRRLGIAPLTSMFLQGRFSTKRYHKLIRAAHDSDGLLAETAAGVRLWWPLRNPNRLALYRLPLANPRGFGLMQRARRPEDYRAFGMHYEDRPSAWVKPVGPWGAGHLLLVELPTNSQTNDNISVFWVPKHQAPPGQPMTFAYTVSWRGKDPAGRGLGYVVASRHTQNKDGQETYVINFSGPRLAHLAPTAVAPAIHVVGPARVVQAWAARDGEGGDWRLQFTLAPTGSGSAVVHAALAAGGTRLTETWADVFPLP
ncbi:MAG: glucan biosynthesis protein [Gammaproteobacteria bacterium]|nr:glucan biosynthesis protein [Gammaproteobacteria bacterium]